MAALLGGDVDAYRYCRARSTRSGRRCAGERIVRLDSLGSALSGSCSARRRSCRGAVAGSYPSLGSGRGGSQWRSGSRSLQRTQHPTRVAVDQALRRRGPGDADANRTPRCTRSSTMPPRATPTRRRRSSSTRSGLQGHFR
jgi:hypothetical protein